jgi:hypothetical protein
MQRVIPIMEAVVTLDPQFVDAWSTVGWHWAYNIYADIEDPNTRPELKNKPERIREEQKRAVDIGLQYLSRGAALNPDTYKLWFDLGWTRAEKAGYYDEETIEAYNTARAQKDARSMKSQEFEGGKTKEVITQGMDVVGHMTAHVYEKNAERRQSSRSLA